MSERRQNQHRSRLRIELHRLQKELTENWIDRSLPEGWNQFDEMDPIEPHKTKVTLRVDTDVIKWFRKMGPGYQARINAVLRVYWHAVLSGDVKSHWANYAEMDQFMRATGLYRDAEGVLRKRLNGDAGAE